MKKRFHKQTMARRRRTVGSLLQLQKEFELLARRAKTKNRRRQPVDHRPFVRLVRRALRVTLKKGENGLLRAGSIAKAVAFIIKLVREIHAHF